RTSSTPSSRSRWSPAWSSSCSPTWCATRCSACSSCWRRSPRSAPCSPTPAATRAAGCGSSASPCSCSRCSSSCSASPRSPRAPRGVPAGGCAVPVDGAVVGQPYGCTALGIEPRSRLCAQGHFHSGLDLAAPAGTPVRATLAGVARVVLSPAGYGLHVVLDHGAGLSSLYAHLSAAWVLDGAAVAAGEVIGAVGSSGNSTGPHLHFEIRR